MELVGEPLDIGSVSGFVSFSAAVDRQFQFMCRPPSSLIVYNEMPLF